MPKRKVNFKRLIETDSELNNIQDLDLLLERILLEARRFLHADAGSIYVKEGDRLQIRYAQNDTKQKELPPGQKSIYSVFSVPIDQTTVSGYCASTGKLINIPDVYHIPDDSPFRHNPSYDRISRYRTCSTLTVPLMTPDSKLLGVLQIINALDERGEPVAFTKDAELLIAHFATNATVALQRAYITRAMILRMIRMSELRDPKETGAHVNRVAGYAVEIFTRWAQRHKLNPHELEKKKDTLRIAAMLHDVGKVAISDLILKKPARFTPEEYAVMQAHTYFGARLFDDPQSELDTLCAEVALTHHENWDGSGYPGWVDPSTGEPQKRDENGVAIGRVGEEIPLAGRIVSVADVYDALCSRRVYKQAWDEQDVCDEMRKLAGSKFDPELIDIFFEILPNIKQVKSLFPESQ